MLSKIKILPMPTYNDAAMADSLLYGLTTLLA